MHALAGNSTIDNGYRGMYIIGIIRTDKAGIFYLHEDEKSLTPNKKFAKLFHMPLDFNYMESKIPYLKSLPYYNNCIVHSRLTNKELQEEMKK